MSRPTVLVRNLDYHPFIDAEGQFTKSLPRPPPQLRPNRYWFDGLPPHERIYYHQTLNSTRRFAGFRPYADKIPGDSLDLVLQSQYQHGSELFADKVDLVMTHETVGRRRTHRRLRNTRDVTPERVIAIGHPLVVGGIRERVSVDNVKLMCSGPHTNQTNPGYSRQLGDGNVFNY